MNPPVVVPEESGAACQPGADVAVGADVAGAAAALIGCFAVPGDPVWAVISWEYALPAAIININKVNMRSFFMVVPLLSEIDIKGRPALQVF
jgi:hypothetical protein